MFKLWSSIDIRLRLALVALVAGVVLPVAWYLGSPLFIDKAVNEEFPAAVVPADELRAEAEAPLATATMDRVAVQSTQPPSTATEPPAMATPAPTQTRVAQSRPPPPSPPSAPNRLVKWRLPPVRLILSRRQSQFRPRHPSPLALSR